VNATPPTSRRRAVRIGITGPIGCGKSTISSWLGERPGVVVVDADQVAREVLDPGEAALEAVLARFGTGLRLADGSLDRAALGRVVFADVAALRDLEAIVHPAVRPRILAAMAGADRRGASAVVIEAIKLVEGGLAALCDEVWLVTCNRGTQRARLVGRGSSEADADQRIAAQADVVARLRPAATRTMDASGEVATTRQMVEAAIDDALARSHQLRG
jgi:dephospho-CoA kinase